MKMLFIFAFLFAIQTSVAANCSDTEKDLRGKVGIVTGAAKGIGYAIVDNLIEQGARLIFILDIDVKNGARAAQTFNSKYGPGKAVFIKCDITTDLYRVLNEILKTCKKIDFCVNNAGILNELEPRKMITTNAIATVEWSLKFREIMRKDKGGCGGTIINIASVSGYMTDPFLYSYKCSKYAVIGFSLSLGQKLNYEKSCVRILTVNPGMTNTTMTRQKNMVVEEQSEYFNKFKKNLEWQQPDSVGKAVVQVFKNAKSGTAWDAVGGKPPSESPRSYSIPDDELDAILRS